MNRQIAIITGTSRLKGIGRAICLELAKNGIEIFLHFGLTMTNKGLGKQPTMNQTSFKQN